VFAAAASGGLAGLWWVTRDPTPGPGDEGAGYWWPLWIGLLWALLVLLHFLHATGRIGIRRWRAHALFAALANAGLAGLWWFTRDPTPTQADEGAGYWWPLWLAFGWGLAVFLHYCYATGRLAPQPGQPSPATTLPPRSSTVDAPAARLLDPLTPREREILALVAQGHSNREIAKRLVISERTARTHVSSILRKLELPTRTQAALAAVHAGLTDATA
jgi:DNA-binding CsgD family transcriptional regulator